MRGGGCFTGGCDDLDTFPVEVRDGAIYIDVRTGSAKRKDAHFLLLKEGLLSSDNWTLSKAIAIMLAKGVSEQETLKLVVRHMGRHLDDQQHYASRPAEHQARGLLHARPPDFLIRRLP